MQASLVTPQKATPKPTKMGTETVEWNPKAGDVQYVVNEKTLTIPTKDRGIRIVTHPNPKTTEGLVGNEGIAVGDHVVSGTGISHSKTERSAIARGRNGVHQRPNKDGRKNNVFYRLSSSARRGGEDRLD
jgi:hypothetical protein